MCFSCYIFKKIRVGRSLFFPPLFYQETQQMRCLHEVYNEKGSFLGYLLKIQNACPTVNAFHRMNLNQNKCLLINNRTLGFLRRNLFSCPQNVQEAAYKGMVRPILEYGSSVRDPHPDKLQEELEKVQNRAARFVTRNYVYETGSMTGILGQLKWESLKKRRKDNRLLLL